jgi:2-polyprenyl-3-methyl-5-hydroxy-6-metoxy-1,4-benzoquinol methylase
MQGDETAHSEALAASWNENAANWTAAVREGLIPSRKAGTDEAILAAIAKHQPARFLDVGCGEGWLVRRVVQAIGCEAVGVDGTAQLVQDARRADPQNRYEVITYRRLMDGAADLGAAFDVIAFNYALFDEQTPELLTAVQRYLSSDGVIIIRPSIPGPPRRKGNTATAGVTKTSPLSRTRTGRRCHGFAGRWHRGMALSARQDWWCWNFRNRLRSPAACHCLCS